MARRESMHDTRVPRTVWISRTAVLVLGLLAAMPPVSRAAPLFRAPFLSFPTGSGPTAVAIGDLNGDGRPDMVVANYGDSTISVLLGRADSTFGAKRDYVVGRQPRSVAIRDLNGDGLPDLAVANHGSGTVSVLLGRGDGTFGAKTDFDLRGAASTVAMGT